MERAGGEGELRVDSGPDGTDEMPQPARDHIRSVTAGVGSVLHSLRVVLAKKVRTDPAPAVTDAIQLQACVQADLDYINHL